MNYFVWTLKMKRAPLISRDFEEILSAPLEIQIFKIINIKRPPNLVPAGGLKEGGLTAAESLGGKKNPKFY